LTVPPVYLDECLDLRLAPALRTRGASVLTAPEAGMMGASDDAQFRFARDQDRLIISYNRRHFRRLHALAIRQGEAHPGIVVLPATSPLNQLAIRAAMMLDWIAGQGDHHSRLFEWGRLQLLLTQSFRLAGYTEDEVRIALGQRMR
jgi:hypothetical protein